jgi:hypothetical protein
MAEEIEDEDINDLSRRHGSHWERPYVETLFDWIRIAAFNISCLELCIVYYRTILRNQTIFGLILSTASGTLSVSQFGVSDSSLTSFIIKVCFTFFSFAMAISTGWLKIYQIQERLEASIKLKQDWIVFSTTIASELQLPRRLRRDGLWLIRSNKDIYLELLKSETEIPSHIKKKVIGGDLSRPQDKDMNMISLPHIMIDICNTEMNDIVSGGGTGRHRATQTVRRRPAIAAQESATTNINDSFPQTVELTVAATQPLTPPALPVRVG